MATGEPVRPDITVVIPTVGREILGRALDSILAGTRLPSEVIVVDQGSSPAIDALVQSARARGLRARWIPSAQTGRSAGVNRGIEAAATRFVAITDDDCLVHPEWLERLGAILEREPDIIVTGRVEAGDDTVILSVTAPKPTRQRRRSLGFDRLSGGNMALARDVAARIGPLDEDPRVRTAEDHEYAYRALRAGVSIQYAPEVAVTHLGWRDAGARDQQYRDYARSHGGFYGKYLRRGDGFIALRATIHWCRALRRWIAAVLTRNPERASMAGAYVRGLPSGIVSGWRRPSGAQR